MDSHKFSRREAISRAGLLMGAAWVGPSASLECLAAEPETKNTANDFVLCLNSGTIRGQKLGLVKEIELVAAAGYQAIEPWIESIDAYAKSGGSLKDVRSRASDLGLRIESAIGFSEWLAEDQARRAKGLERAKRDMDLVAQIGGKRLAAPPAGATNEPVLDLHVVTERYRALLELGDQMGIVPELEVWAFSKNLHHLSDCTFVALEARHPKACVLADLFHLYKGGSGFEGLRLLSGNAIQVFHMNDYPSEPPPDKIDDSYRVFPGDGVAPMTQILRDLRSTGPGKVLSLELFSRKYWAQDPMEVAKTGLAKLKAAVEKTLAPA